MQHAFRSTSILTLTGSDIILCVSMSIVVILIFVLFYNRIFAVTFDESFASATGVNASAYNLLIAITTAVVIVLAMNLVGALLTSALIIFPALSAMRIFSTFRQVIVALPFMLLSLPLSEFWFSIILSTAYGRDHRGDGSARLRHLQSHRKNQNMLSWSVSASPSNTP